MPIKMKLVSPILPFREPKPNITYVKPLIYRTCRQYKDKLAYHGNLRTNCNNGDMF